MNFLKYPSIINHTDKKSLDFWLDLYPELADISYVITHKIHGSNIQAIIKPNGDVSWASRNHILSPDANFFGLNDVINGCVSIGGLIYALKETYKNKLINLYGELYGPGVQKGVYYGENRRIRFFDFAVDGVLRPQSEFLVFMHDHAYEIRLQAEILGYTHGLQNAIQTKTEHNIQLISYWWDDYTTDYSNAPEVNIIEGIVIKPLKNVYVSGNGSVFMIKKKNEAFKVAKTTKSRHEPKDLGELQPYADAFADYVTEQRLDSVVSHIGEIEKRSQIGNYITALIEDAIEEFNRENELPNFTKSERKIVYSVGSQRASKLVKERMCNVEQDRLKQAD